MQIKRALLSLARSPIGRVSIGWIFAHMSAAIPVKHLYETERVVAFPHPQPSYPLHILLVPKRAVPGIQDLHEKDMPLILELLEGARALVDRFQLEQGGYRLIVNGGAYQDVPQLHIHLVADHAVVGSAAEPQAGPVA